MIPEKKILVVSGDPVLLGFLHHNLHQASYQVAAAQDTGEELRKTLDGVKPDLIILDIVMPELDGIEMCLRIRQWSEVPIMMLSVWGAGKDRVRGLDLSSDCYLTEPFGIGDLTTRIEEIFHRISPDQFSYHAVGSEDFRN